MKSSPVFEQLVEQCGLSKLFARRAMERACERAGVEADQLQLTDLALLMPEIDRAIRPFLEPDEHQAALARLTQLARR